MKYGDAVSTSRVIYQVSTSLQLLVEIRKPGVNIVPHRWHGIIQMMENYTPRLRFHKICWEFLEEGWLKVHTYGTSRGNPGRSAFGFCVRNENGMYAMQ